METIGKQVLWTFEANSNDARKATCVSIRMGTAHVVTNYMDLATKVAALQFLNRDFVLMFRGQSADHRNLKRNTTLKPTLFRPLRGASLPDATVLQARFDRLRRAERRLVDEYVSNGFPSADRIKRLQLLRWSILQHYQVCDTPLLDLTHSLRIAASFASEGADSEAYVFVLGVPNLSGAITASAEAGIQIVRLSSVCPPTALRPHIQEGYLVGEYPEMTGYEQKQHYGHFEIDFGRRLIAKFRFDSRTFWVSEAFPIVEKSALYPNAADPLFELAQEISAGLAS